VVTRWSKKTGHTSMDGDGRLGCPGLKMPHNQRTAVRMRHNDYTRYATRVSLP
jgi:hypothetical protein